MDWPCHLPRSLHHQDRPPLDARGKGKDGPPEDHMLVDSGEGKEVDGKTCRSIQFMAKAGRCGKITLLPYLSPSVMGMRVRVRVRDETGNPINLCSNDIGNDPLTLELYFLNIPFL